MKVSKFLLKSLGISTYRQFKSVKRYELRMALKAITILRRGCIYLPNGPKLIHQAEDCLIELKKEISVKKWGK